ncbi:MAG: HisA/HisF-related TIM barrel protein [Alphaproteobacteria bacterium]
MLKNRYIPVLQILDRKLVKTIKFVPKRYLGDPLNAIRIFNLKGVNELVITDIGATLTKKIDFEFLKKLSAQAFVPLTYGGGISSVEDVNKLYQLGFDRILLGSAGILNPKIIDEIARIYGSQSIICSLDVMKTLFGYKIKYHGSRDSVSANSLDFFIRNFIDHGAGEILLHDINRDGTFKGLDCDLIHNVAQKSSIPVMVCGGASSLIDMDKALSSGASAVAAGSFFSFYGKHKAVLINYGVDS